MSQYGAEFDRKAETWRVIENQHDLVHPDRGMCGGVGGCSLMMVANQLEHEMITDLTAWRARNPL